MEALQEPFDAEDSIGVWTIPDSSYELPPVSGYVVKEWLPNFRHPTHVNVFSYATDGFLMSIWTKTLPYGEWVEVDSVPKRNLLTHRKHKRK